MKVLKEKKSSCNCYGCIEKLYCQCSQCVLKKECLKNFCLLKFAKTHECSVCFSKFKTLEHLKKHRQLKNHKHKQNHVAFGKSSSKNEDLPKATWIDMYMSGDFENDSAVTRMTKSKMLKTVNKSE